MLYTHRGQSYDYGRNTNGQVIRTVEVKYVDFWWFQLPLSWFYPFWYRLEKWWSAICFVARSWFSCITAQPCCRVTGWTIFWDRWSHRLVLMVFCFCCWRGFSLFIIYTNKNEGIIGFVCLPFWRRFLLSSALTFLLSCSSLREAFGRLKRRPCWEWSLHSWLCFVFTARLSFISESWFLREAYQHYRHLLV